MRSEAEMLDTILRFAKEDQRIRAVILNGSRVNAQAPRDIFQDYDVIYIVTSVDGFVQDRTWIQNFGELIIMQTPEENALFSSGNITFGFLMLFQDGNRVDLTLYPADKLCDFKPESLSVVLLDKDQLLGTLAPPSNEDHKPVPPTAAEFSSCCNEFWWVSTYVAKGLWRRELPYAKFMFERPVRDMLHVMLKWSIGCQTNFTADSGKCGKYFEKHLTPERWQAYLNTFADGDYDNAWQALFRMCHLFRETATEVACHFGYDYPVDEGQRVTAYLQHVRELPKDADGVY